MGETVITHEFSRDESVCGVFCKNEPEVSFKAFGYTFHWCRDCYNEPCSRCREEIPESARGSTRAKGWCEDCREEIGLLVGDGDRGIQKDSNSDQTKLMTDGGTDGLGGEDAIVHGEVEVSKHLIVDAFGVDKLGVEWEVHTGFNDPYYVEEDVARRVKQNLGLDLENGRYQSGGDVIVVSDAEVDDAE